MAPVLPLQEQQMTGTATTLRLLTLRRLATSLFTRFGCLLIAAAENTYYSRIQQTDDIEMSMSWITSRVFGLSSMSDRLLQTQETNTATLHSQSRRSSRREATT